MVKIIPWDGGNGINELMNGPLRRILVALEIIDSEAEKLNDGNHDGKILFATRGLYFDWETVDRSITKWRDEIKEKSPENSAEAASRAV